MDIPGYVPEYRCSQGAFSASQPVQQLIGSLPSGALEHFQRRAKEELTNHQPQPACESPEGLQLAKEVYDCLLRSSLNARLKFLHDVDWHKDCKERDSCLGKTHRRDAQDQAKINDDDAFDEKVWEKEDVTGTFICTTQNTSKYLSLL
jgi:hypothetical protein